ncbi:c-type cytochrome [soil metagenome]
MNLVMSPAGPFAGSISALGWVLCIGASVIFLGVMGLLAWALARGGAKVGTVRWVIGGGLVFPLVVLTALFVSSSAIGGRLQPNGAPPGALIVEVTGKMWWWEVRYRLGNLAGSAPGKVGEVVLANEIRIPVGRPVYLGLTTSDVIHSFWVPQLAGKIDMVPGRVNGLLLQADKPGVYRGQCAEYCGEQHAKMAMHVVAMETTEFAEWLKRQSMPVRDPPSGNGDPALAALQLRGRQAFVDSRCVSCHTVRGVATEARLGPDLTHVGSRLYLGAGVVRNDRQAMADWIAQTQLMKPGAHMPSFSHLGREDIDAISAYLSSLE